jgi:hypothetical protein
MGSALLPEPWEDALWCSSTCGCCCGALLLLLLEGPMGLKLKPRCDTVGPLTSLLLQLWRTRGV